MAPIATMIKKARKMAYIQCSADDGGKMCVTAYVKRKNKRTFTIRGCYTHVTQEHFNASDANYNTMPPDGCYNLQSPTTANLTMDGCFCSNADYCNANVSNLKTIDPSKKGTATRRKRDSGLTGQEWRSVAWRQRGLIRGLNFRNEF